MNNLSSYTHTLFNKHIGEDYNVTFPFFYSVLLTSLPELTNDFIIKIANINLLIYINSDYKFSEYIKNKLQLILPGKINFTLVDTSEMLEDSELFEINDLIITNAFTLPTEVEDDKVIKISHYLSLKDINYINEQVIHFYQKNGHNIINNKN